MLDHRGQKWRTQKEIHTLMTEHYTRLYETRLTGNSHSVESFLATVELSTLTVDQFLDLDSPLMEEEIKDARHSLSLPAKHQALMAFHLNFSRPTLTSCSHIFTRCLCPQYLREFSRPPCVKPVWFPF